MTTTRATPAAASTAIIVSEARARASSARRAPASPASRDLASASTLTGISTYQPLSVMGLILPRHRTT